LRSTSGRAVSDRRRRRCGGPVRPWARKHCHQCRPPPTDHTTTSAGPPPNSGRGLLASCGDVEPNPGPGRTEVAGFPLQVLDIHLTAPGIRSHFALQPDASGQTLWWCVRCGMSWQAPPAAATCPDGCAPTAGPPPRGQRSWLRHRQLVIGQRCPKYQDLRRAGRIDTGSSTPRIDDLCRGRRWNRQYYTWRRLLHWLAVTLALHSPCPPGPSAPARRIHGRCVSCPARLGSQSTGREASLFSFGDVEANPGPPNPDWGEEDYAVLPDLVQEAFPRLGIAPVRDAFATPTNRRFPAFWTKAEDAFDQAWDYPSAGALWANPPLQPPRRGGDEGVAGGLPDAGRRPGVVRARVCALCHKRWCFPCAGPVLRVPPARGHGPGSCPAMKDMDLPLRLPPGRAWAARRPRREEGAAGP